MENLMYNLAFKYIFILFILMCFIILPTGISYYMTVKNMETNQERLNLETAIQIKNIVNERLNEINNIVNNLGTYYQTSYVMSLSSDWRTANPSDILYAKKYIDYIDNLKHSNDLVAEISIFSQFSNCVFTSKGVRNFSQWYGTSFPYSNITDEMWTSNISNLSGQKLLAERTYYDNGIPVSVIPYIQKLPLGSKKNIVGYICLLIKRNSLFGWTSKPGYDYFYILDAESNIITSLGSAFFDTSMLSFSPDMNQGYYIHNMDNNKQIVTFIKSNNGLTYITLTPYTVVMKQVKYFKELFVAMVTLSLILCLIAIILSIFKIQKPIKHLATAIINLTTRVLKQEGELKTAILRRLLSGNISNYEETAAELVSLGIPVNSEYFCVIKFVIESQSNNDSSKQRDPEDYLEAKSLIRELVYALDTFTIDMDINSTAIIYKSDRDDVQSCRQQIIESTNKLQEELEPYEFHIYAGGGNFYRNIFNIHASYLEASFALKNAMPKDPSRVFWYDELDYIPLFYYPPETEKKILLGVNCCDDLIVEEILDEIHHKNFCELKISDNAAEILLLKLLSTLLLATNESTFQKAGLHQEIMAFAFDIQAKQYSYNSSFLTFKKFFKDICQLSKSASSIKSLEKQSCILEFINKHCYEQQMSLAYVSKEFNISESYLSAMFKEQNHINFMAYVENKRLEAACGLLKNRKKTIDEIAFEVGYTSSHSFRRAFKRKYGVSPANYQLYDNLQKEMSNTSSILPLNHTGKLIK